jgi:hypothetical protein
MDLLTIGASSAALIFGAAIGWLLARSRFTRILERRVNRQLSESVQFDAVPRLTREPDLTLSGEPTRETLVPSAWMQRSTDGSIGGRFLQLRHCQES